VADLVTIEQVRAHLNLGSDTTHDEELLLFISAATDHVANRYGTLPSDTYTETLPAVDDERGTYRYHLYPYRTPVTAVTSATDEAGTEYTTGFTISPDGRKVRHDSIVGGDWTLVYTAGEAISADLKLAALEDIRGLFQPGQIGPPASFGAFGVESAELGAPSRPVNLWPRLDNWIYARLGPGIA
jgi:hypothetical protein